MRRFINRHKPYWYISWRRRHFMHKRLMAQLEALTDPTLIDRMLAGE